MMGKMLITRVLTGFLLALMLGARVFAQSAASQSPNTGDNDELKAQAGCLIQETIARAEDRTEALRSRLVELQIQEVDLQSRLDDLDYALTPDSIQRALAFVGSVRPMDELRASLRERLESEKARLTKQLELLASGRERLEAELSRADAEVDRLRQRLACISWRIGAWQTSEASIGRYTESNRTHSKEQMR